MIPLLTRIENELAQCTDPLKAAELQAEKAVYLARIGEFEGAGELVKVLRGSHGQGRSVRISIWIMLIEGLILFFEKIDLSARDRIYRAHALSQAAALIDLHFLTGAWLAHIDFNRSDFSSMLKSLAIFRSDRIDEVNSANARASLVIADAIMHAGLVSQARRWYLRTHHQAVMLGDEATLAALMYNKAASGLSQLRLAATKGEVDVELLNFVSMEMASASNFHAMVKHDSLSQLLDACKAQILLLQGKYSEAWLIFDHLLSHEDLVFGFKSDRLILQIEAVRCLLGMNQLEQAGELIDGIDVPSYADMTIDDQLVFVSMYLSTATKAQASVKELVNDAHLQKCRDAYSLEIGSLRRGLAELEVLAN